MVVRFLIAFLLVFLSTPVMANEKKSEATPLTRLDAATKNILEGLNANQTKQFASVRTVHGIIRAVEDVERNFDRALVSCSKHNPDMADKMRNRMIEWKSDLDPVMGASRERLKTMISLQDYAAPAEAKSYLKLVDAAVAYKARDVKVVPIQSKVECEKLLETMDDNQKDLKKLLIENVGLEKDLARK